MYVSGSSPTQHTMADAARQAQSPSCDSACPAVIWPTPCCATQAIPGSPSSAESPRRSGEPALGQGSPDALPLDGLVGGGGGAVTHGRGPRLYVGGVPDDVQVRLHLSDDVNFLRIRTVMRVCNGGRACCSCVTGMPDSVQASSSLKGVAPC